MKVVKDWSLELLGHQRRVTSVAGMGTRCMFRDVSPVTSATSSSG